MRGILKISIICLTIVCFFSCDYVTVGGRYKRFLSQPVVFPASLIRVAGINDSNMARSEEIIRFVVYIDSLNCSSCEINRLSRFDEYASLAETNMDFQIVVVIWPDSEARGTIVKGIEHRRLPFDVYVDYEGQFSKSNQNLPRSDARFHAFLLNRDNLPIMVGDPTSSKQIKSLFMEQYNKVFNPN